MSPIKTNDGRIHILGQWHVGITTNGTIATTYMKMKPSPIHSEESSLTPFAPFEWARPLEMAGKFKRTWQHKPKREEMNVK